MKINLFIIIVVIISADIAWGQDTKPVFGHNNSYHGSLIKLEEASISHRNYEHRRDPYFPDKDSSEWQNVTDFNLKIGVLKSLYWDNQIHFEMDQTQVRSAGWEWTIGIRLYKWMDIVKHHHSKHVLEESRTIKFPVEDSYGVKFNLIN